MNNDGKRNGSVSNLWLKLVEFRKKNSFEVLFITEGLARTYTFYEKYYKLTKINICFDLNSKIKGAIEDK